MAIKNIYLFCSAGMSSSVLVTKMRDLVASGSLPLHVEYFPEAKMDEKIPGADLVLLSPQIRFRKDYVLNKFPDKKIHVIDVSAYGLMQADKVLDACLSLLDE